MSIEEIKKKRNVTGLKVFYTDISYAEIDRLISRVEELEKGIRKHKNQITRYMEKYSNVSWSHDEDDELYELIEKENV